MEFDEALRIVSPSNARALAGDLFREAFGQDFPEPRENAGLTIPTPPSAWRQFVALYRWPNGQDEAVGFCNWIKHHDVYLEGGLCVKKNFYRRLPRSHFDRCLERGGIAQIVMDDVAQILTDCKAWFGYCGDKKALAAGLRTGYLLTHHNRVIVKWFADLSDIEQRALTDKVAAIGPF